MFLSNGLVPRTSAVTFPLKIATGSRTLVDSSGRPFFLAGRASWGILGLTPTDRDSYLNDCVARGFTAIEFPAPCTPDGANGGLTTVNPNLPADSSGNLPWSKQLDGSNWTAFLENYSNINTQAPDMTTINSSFWASVDALLTAAAIRGLACIMFPAYVGFAATHQGWMDEMVANGNTNMATYGAAIANRYATQSNIIWAIGGDRGTGSSSTFSAPQLAAETAFVNALLSNSPHTPALLVTAEWARGSIGPDQSTLGSNVTLSGFYGDATDICNQGGRSYAYSPTLPGFCIEDIYDNNTDSGVRRLQWWAVFTGIGGFCTGNDYVYPFDAAGTWKTHLNDSATLDLQRLSSYIRTIGWPDFAPSSALISAGGGTPNSADQCVAILNAAATHGVVYRPPAHSGTITLDMSQFSKTMRSRFWDPTGATYTPDATGLSNSGTHPFTFPGTNVGGQTDWALELD